MNPFRLFLALTLAWLAVTPDLTSAADFALLQKMPGDQTLVEYFRGETARLADRCLAEVKSLEDWKARRETYRRQLFEMLSLDPLPPRSDLKAEVTGSVGRDDFTVENVHFQSSPGLYITANLYLPKHLPAPAPTILYLSGHGPVISNGVSYGNKVTYQHHGAWFARNGYVCLVLDTLQLGEILGLHHGTHREGLWWWNARGYTPAGVEAWNCIRALDYLSTRPEVDTNRFGATGRSGGGAYSWWIAALDDRIKAVAPVAGITDLRNHVVDGTVEGHCDCMFTVNTYRWDYPQVAALVAPRPLLIVNTDSDYIFPLDGVQRTHARVRRIYDLHKAADKLGLVIGPGPHKDTQDLQVPVFRWFNKHLKGEDPLIEMAAVKLFRPEQLKVFATLPADSINTNIHETFVPAAPAPSVPRSKDEWGSQRDGWLAALREKCFAGWPEEPGPLRLERKFSATRDGLTLEAFDFNSEPETRLRLYVLTRPTARPQEILVNVHDEAGWPDELGWLRTAFETELPDEPPSDPTRKDGTFKIQFETYREALKGGAGAMAFFAPRGTGVSAWSGDARRQTQIRRRFMLLGQTLDSARVWDIRRACQALRLVPRQSGSKLNLNAQGAMAVNVVYASLFESGIAGLQLNALAASHRSGPDYLNVLRVLEVPQAVAMAAERCPVRLFSTDTAAWQFPVEVAWRLGWDKARFLVQPPAGPPAAGPRGANLSSQTSRARASTGSSRGSRAPP
jgi:dienelactone hydrolase